MPDRATSRASQLPEATISATPASRRAVLRGLSLAGIATSSLTALTIPAAAIEPPVENEGLQYRETDHIRHYYALARR
jgi:hypothetical protein